MRSLLMGGQACVLYGGAEFSRDTDLVIVSDVANLDRLRAAVARLLREEEDREREADRQYWAPLRSRLEALRREHHDRR